MKLVSCPRQRDLTLLSFILRPSLAVCTSSTILHASSHHPSTESQRPFSVLNRPPPNYPGHVPLTRLERLGLAVGSAVTSLIDPYRHDMVAACGEATAQPFFITALKTRMLSDPTGRRILRDRPRITSKTLPLEMLRALPQDSVGRTYAAWLDREGVTPDTRDNVRYIDDEEEAYVMQRYRECHDFYHAVTGLPVWVEGEIGLKAFEFANTGLPMTGLSLAAIVRLKPAERKRMFEIFLPWAFANGWKSHDLINVYWEEELETPVEELRQRLGIEQPPDLREIRRQLREQRRAVKAAQEAASAAPSSTVA
ncbi:Ubiquinone biosynthesis protein coq4, mitochondrial [Exophiala mesophila]|uniref:4-hydroxy-3-methoxy-5-polyprenylbenzoate decarboxylase n=1 Tax=Exophiala mesophila TaxID=212818 RepID=A0A438NAW9_EXOME|nr:Ubiquinone biosynthesis protein coq4, mitochondrial [Exophiala mesophila]